MGTRALLFAGARSVVVTLWSVPDCATSELMQLFYGRIREGEDVAEALSGAKAKMRETRPTRSSGLRSPSSAWVVEALGDDGIESSKPGVCPALRVLKLGPSRFG